MKTINIKNYHINKGSLILINPLYAHVFPDEQDQLIQISKAYPNILLEKEAAQSLNRLIDDIDPNHQIIPISGYRSIEEQSNLYLSSIEENGIFFTRKYVAKEYHSEHSTGYAIDLGLKNYENNIINPIFNHHPVASLFKEKAKYYGFITRYPDEKQEITKIYSEPWHFRYVGFPHSLLIEENQLVLEEYIELLTSFTNIHPMEVYDKINHYKIFFTDTNKLEIEDSYTYDVSGTNINGFIVTLKEIKNEKRV